MSGHAEQANICIRHYGKREVPVYQAPVFEREAEKGWEGMSGHAEQANVRIRCYGEREVSVLEREAGKE